MSQLEKAAEVIASFSRDAYILNTRNDIPGSHYAIEFVADIKNWNSLSKVTKGLKDALQTDFDVVYEPYRERDFAGRLRGKEKLLIRVEFV